MNQELLNQALWAIERAKAAGAAQVSAMTATSRTVTVEYRRRMPETVQESASRYLSLDVYIDGRYSSHATSDLRQEALQDFIADAVAMTRHLAVDPYRELPDPRWYEGRQERDLQLYDPSIGSLTSEARHEVARELEDAALSKSDAIVSVTSSVSDKESESVMVHSNGFEGHKRLTSFRTGVSVTVQGREDRRPTGSESRSTRQRSQLPPAGELGEGAFQRAFEQIGARRIDSRALPMVVESRLSGGLLARLLEAFYGSKIQQQQSFLQDKLNQPITSDILTVIDDPFVEQGLGSRLFDGQGLTARPLPIIEAGVLRNFYLDVYYARKLSTDPTTGSSSNLTIRTGTRNVEEIMSALGSGILVRGFLGGNSNVTSGDFSLGIQGQFFDAGQISHPVSEMNVSGNHLTFWNQLVELGNDPYEYSSYRTPSFVFENVSFSGA